MSAAFKPNVSALQIVEADVSKLQNNGTMADLSQILEQE